VKRQINEWPWASHKSRTVETTMARLRIGHVGLAQHQFRFNLSESEMCSCGQIESVEHYLLLCPNYRHQREKLFKNLRLQKVTPSLCNLLGGGNFDNSTQNKIVTYIMVYIKETQKLGKI